MLPEGVWGVVSSDIPGLNIEAATKEEAESEVKQWAHELLVDNNIISQDTLISLVFY
jgi:predicted RNase H-like HicB family nuclease